MKRSLSTKIAFELVKRGLKDIKSLKENIPALVEVKNSDRTEALVELITRVSKRISLPL